MFSLRILLPPNLAEAARRDAIAVKVVFDLTAPPPVTALPALALLQRWCGGQASPPLFLQLKRAQLRELLGALTGQPVFAWVNKPEASLLWIGPHLRGVTEALAEETVTKPEPIPTVPVIRSVPRTLRVEEPGAMTIDGSEQFLAIGLPSREQAAYAAALDLVKNAGFTLEPSNRKWWLRDRHKVLNFLAAHGPALRDEFRAEFTENFERNTRHLREAEIACEVAGEGADFHVTVGLKAEGLSDDALRAAIGSNRGYVEANGKVLLLPPATVKRVADAQRALAGEPPGMGAPALTASRRTHRLGTVRIPEVQALIEELAPHYQPPEGWRVRAEALRQLSTLPPAPASDVLTALLRPYQRLGAAWLWHLYRHGLGGILADEMGLGKTLQAIALLDAIAATRGAGRFECSLVVCPASLVENWRREIVRFAPALRVFVHHGSNRLTGPDETADCDIVVTSYGTLSRDRALFGERELACLIADEAQHVKNRRTQNAQALRALRARGRFLLTGTPAENSLDDLRALFELLMPGYLDKVPSGVRREERVWFDERLRAKTAPYILRRTKLAVAPELPAKIEQVVYCEPTPAQARLYREWQEKSERALFDLEAGGASENSIRMATLTQLLRLRQICCDPRLVESRETPAGVNYADSAKLEAFRELLAEAVDDGHRLLVFSQFTALLALVRAELEGQELSYCYLDGSMSARQRQAEVDRFNGSAEIPVFLISLKAGGVGLNLTGADTVVHFDPWWNPAVEAQATDRAHRIGQTRVVTSYKLICAGTVEEKVLALQESKRALLAEVFEASDAASAKLNLADLKSLLAK